MAAVFGPGGQNMAIIFCPDQILQPYLVPEDKIWQDKLLHDMPRLTGLLQVSCT